MKALFLIQNNTKQKQQTYLYLEVKDTLDSYGDLINEGIITKELISIPQDSNRFMPYYRDKKVNKLNFKSISGAGVPVIESPLTKASVEKNSLTCVTICYNLAGEKLGIIASDTSGNLYMFNIPDVIAKIKLFNNLFTKNGKELVLTKGSYNAQGSLVPTIKLGKSLGKEVEVKEDLVEKNVSKKYDLTVLNKFREPIKAMIIKGYKPYIDMFKLNDLKNPFPDDTLWFYKDLMDVKEFKPLSRMITREPFNIGQLIQIYLGIKSGVDVTKYAEKRIDESKMQDIREALEKGTFDGIVIPDRLKKLKDEYNKSGQKDKNIGKQILKVSRKIRSVSKSSAPLKTIDLKGKDLEKEMQLYIKAGGWTADSLYQEMFTRWEINKDEFMKVWNKLSK